MNRCLFRLLFFLILAPIFCFSATNNIEYYKSITCLIDSKDSRGTGVFITSTNGIIYCLTAFHVVESSKRIFGNSFDDVKVDIFTVQDDIKVGLIESDAEVYKYDEREDLCLLKLRQKYFTTNCVKFYKGDEKDIKVGFPIFHLGNFWGITGFYSYSEGIINHKGRILEEKKYWQGNLEVMNGSSGGGVYLSDSSYIGMVTRKRETACLFIPLSRIKDWANKNEIGYLIN